MSGLQVTMHTMSGLAVVRQPGGQLELLTEEATVVMREG